VSPGSRTRCGVLVAPPATKLVPKIVMLNTLVLDFIHLCVGQESLCSLSKLQNNQLHQHPVASNHFNEKNKTDQSSFPWLSNALLCDQLLAGQRTFKEARALPGTQQTNIKVCNCSETTQLRLIRRGCTVGALVHGLSLSTMTTHATAGLANT
jgi:hypothetical protein